MTTCPACQRPVAEPAAVFCPFCGAPVRWAPEAPDDPEDPSEYDAEGLDLTNPVDTDPPMPAAPDATAPLWPGVDVTGTSTTNDTTAAVESSPADTVEVPLDVRPLDPSIERLIAVAAIISGALAVAGALETWLEIRIGGLAVAGSRASGWDGRDGKTVAVLGGAAAIVGIARLLGRRELWLKVALLVAGGTTLIIAAANAFDVQSKADDIQTAFGIPASDVSAQVGAGLWLVGIAGAGLLVTGLVSRTPAGPAGP